MHLSKDNNIPWLDGKRVLFTSPKEMADMKSQSNGHCAYNIASPGLTMERMAFAAGHANTAIRKMINQ